MRRRGPVDLPGLRDAASTRSTVYPVPSIVLPFYKELHLPRPPFGRVHRAIAAFRPDIVHIATEATLGWSVLRYALRRGLAVVSSFHTNFDQYSQPLRGRLGQGSDLALSALVSQQHARDVRSVEGDDRRSRGDGASSGWYCGGAGLIARCFRPDRPGGSRCGALSGWSPDDVVITYVSRIAPEKNVDYLADALAIVASRRPDVRILLVGDGPSRSARAADRLDRSFRGLSPGEQIWPITTPRPTSSPSRA